MSSLAAPAFVTGEAPASREARTGADALAALVARAREGDGRAFDRLMIETQERVVGLAWRMLGSREDARDAAQEVYLRVFRHLGRYRSELDFHGWLYRITVNVCRDTARRRRRAPVANGTNADPGQPAAAEEALLDAERWHRLLEALASLPAKERWT
jgi:RNA polymerase sigma-70 factor (ECF subfamily)